MEIRLPIGTRYIVIALFGAICTSLSYLTYIYRPAEIIATMFTSFTPNSELFELWRTPTYEVFIKIFMFNVTNPEEFLNGREKLRLNEVGPYTYREVMYNINTTFNDNGTLTFVPKRKLEFAPEHSIGDPTVDTLLLPNLPLLALAAVLHQSSMVTNIAFSSLCSYLGSKPIVNLTVDEYLMGYDDTLVTLANQFVPSWIDFSRFGILDRVMALDNSSELVTIDIKGESENVMQYAIERWAGSPGLSYFGYKDDGGGGTDTSNTKCNTVAGTSMGTLFPANMKKYQSMRLFRRAFCRPIPVNYYDSGYNEDGFEFYLFKQDPNFLLRKENNSDNNCYCQKSNPDECLPNGIGDLSPCYYGIPIGISLPHFLDTDPSVVSKIDGMLPDVEKHGVILKVNPNLGVPLEAHIRAQINLVIPDTKYNSRIKPFNNHIVPLFWADLSAEQAPSEVKFYIRLLYHTLPAIEEVLMYIFVVGGILLISASSIHAVLAFARQNHYDGLKIRYSSVSVTALKQKTSKSSLIV